MKIFVPGFAPVYVDEPKPSGQTFASVADAVNQISIEQAIALAQARSTPPVKQVLDYTRDSRSEGSPLLVNDPLATVPTPLNPIAGALAEEVLSQLAGAPAEEVLSQLAGEKITYNGAEIVFNGGRESPVDLTDEELAVLDAALTK